MFGVLHICLRRNFTYIAVCFQISPKMNFKVVTAVLVVAILVSTFVPQTEAFSAGAGGIGKRQLGSCVEVVSCLNFSSLFSSYLLRSIWNLYTRSCVFKCGRLKMFKNHYCEVSEKLEFLTSFKTIRRVLRSKINEYRQV